MHAGAAGDHVLRAAAQRLQRAVRPSDVVARVGGDEFVVVLAALGGGGGDDDAPEQAVEGVAARVLRELCRPVEVNGVEIEISASVGVAVAPGDADVDVLLASADAAMYQVKRAGGAGHRITIVDRG